MRCSVSYNLLRIANGLHDDWKNDTDAFLRGMAVSAMHANLPFSLTPLLIHQSISSTSA